LTLYLIDTNIVSRVSPTRHRTGDDEALAAWIEAHGDALYLSVVTVAEILDGIARARRQGATRKAAMLDDWWWELSHFWSSRILPVDLVVAGEIGRLLDVARSAGAAPGFEDVAIAATASVHGMVVLTANERHFRPLGIAFVNPLADLPG
jgi:toxin FitB